MRENLMVTLSYTTCFCTYCVSSSRVFGIKTGSNNQLLHNLFTFTSPTAPFQHLGSEVEEAGLCSTRQVHHGECNLLAENLTDLGVQILLTLVRGRRQCLNPKRITHGMEGCDASPLRSCKNQAPLQSCSRYRTAQKRVPPTYCAARKYF